MDMSNAVNEPDQETRASSGIRHLPRSGFYHRFGKRALDVVLASIVLVLVLPLLAIVTVAILWQMGRPVLYREPRAGRGNVPFVLWKFRTMRNEVDGDGRLLPDGDRLTELGRFLRRTSIDELPELLHVVRGHMSLVGPRPLPLRYLSRYSDAQIRRHQATPGITGLAQVRGRNRLSWERKFALDVWYVDHVSLRLDVTLLLATVAAVINGTGVTQPGHATMEEFSGSTKLSSRVASRPSE
jgi:lipopolysaccharide/colanic/teichoic acid biosynthesis glycosyltransferase